MTIISFFPYNNLFSLHRHGWLRLTGLGGGLLGRRLRADDGRDAKRARVPHPQPGLLPEYDGRGGGQRAAAPQCGGGGLGGRAAAHDAVRVEEVGAGRQRLHLHAAIA